MIWTILVGLVVGAVAKFVMPGKDPGGIIVTILLGIAGSYVASLLGVKFGFYQDGDAVGFIGSVIGAIILLFVYRLIFNRKS